MPRREFNQLEEEIQRTLNNFKATLDTGERQELLLRLQDLLDEMDQVPRAEYLN